MSRPIAPPFPLSPAPRLSLSPSPRLAVSPSPRLPVSPFLRLAALLLLLLLSACANPQLPSGGPPDRTPPAIASSTPEAGATNVSLDDRTVRIRFSEYVQTRSFPQAFSVSPPFDGRVEFAWSRREVAITFPQPLQENTTYVLTLDNTFSDVRGVKLNEPITLAFSTGPTINRGRIAGRVVDALTGEGLADYDVYAYVLADTASPTLRERPDYRTQTGTEGTFTLDYLSEQPFYIAALQDANRNRRPDPLEPFAAPPQPVLFADTAGTEPEQPWLSAVLDTFPPLPQRVRALTPRHLEVRFSEDVLLRRRTPASWRLRTETDAALVTNVFTRASEPRVVYLRTDSLRPVPHTLRLDSAVADAAGNVVPDTALTFTPDAPLPPDTLSARFVAFLPEPGRQAPGQAIALPPGEQPALRVNQPLDSTTLAAAVALRGPGDAARSFTAVTDDGTTYRLLPRPDLAPDDTVTLAVDGRALSGRDTTYTRRYTRLSSRSLGALSGYVALPDALGTPFVELYRAVQRQEGERRSELLATVQADTTGHFLFDDLPEGTYRFRAFLDRDADARWDPGSIAPYEPAEAVTWSADTVRVRPRWENELADTLRLVPR